MQAVTEGSILQEGRSGHPVGLTLGLPEGAQEGLRPQLCILGPPSHKGERAGLCLSAIHTARGTPATAAPLCQPCPNHSRRTVLPFFSWSSIRLGNIHIIQDQRIFIAEGDRGTILIWPFISFSRSSTDTASTRLFLDGEEREAGAWKILFFFFFFLRSQFRSNTQPHLKELVGLSS